MVAGSILIITAKMFNGTLFLKPRMQTQKAKKLADRSFNLYRDSPQGFCKSGRVPSAFDVYRSLANRCQEANKLQLKDFQTADDEEKISF